MIRCKKKDVFDIITTLYIVILLGYILISNVRRLYGLDSILNYSNDLIYFGVVGLIIYIVSKIFRTFRFNLYDLLILLLVVFGIISTLFAIDVNASLFGFAGRYEGLFQIMTYYILFLNCKNIGEDKLAKILVWLIIFVGVIHAFYGILQFFDIEYVFGYEIIRNRYYSTGFEVNPNFYGSLMMIALSLSMTIYFLKENKIISILTLLTTSVIFMGFLCSGCMSVAVSLFFLIILLVIIFCILKLDFKKTLIKGLLLIICFVASYLSFNKYDNGYYMFQIGKTTSEIGKTLNGDMNGIYGSGRIHIWTETLRVVPKNLLTGVGIDNFYYAFGKRNLIDIKSRLVVDKAHNEYLQKLITEGIFSCGAYLTLIFMIFIKSIIKIIKNKKNYNYGHIALFLCFTTYCIQAFFNISVISVAPIFYIVMGMLCSFNKDVKYEEVNH